MLQTNAGPISSLIQPVNLDGILLHDEEAYYNERFHWAKLLEPFFQTLALLLAITVLGSGAGGVPVIILVIAGVYYSWTRFRKHSTPAGRWAMLVAVALTAYFLGLEFLTGLAVVASAIRFLHTALVWAFYERLVITNRRVVLAEGLLKTKVSTMPLTRVTDINYTTSISGEFLGYASLRVETAGQDQALSWINYLDRPASFYQTLIRLSTLAVGSVTNLDDSDLDEAEGEPNIGSRTGERDSSGGDPTII